MKQVFAELGELLRPIVREEISLALQGLNSEKKENVIEAKFLTRTEVAQIDIPVQSGPPIPG